MEGNRSKLRAVLVFGAPGSGKTTFAEKFAKKFNLAYYNLDEIREEYGFSHEAVLSILEIITKAKQSIVIEGELRTEKDRTEIGCRQILPPLRCAYVRSTGRLKKLRKYTMQR